MHKDKRHFSVACKLYCLLCIDPQTAALPQITVPTAVQLYQSERTPIQLLYGLLSDYPQILRYAVCSAPLAPRAGSGEARATTDV